MAARPRPTGPLRAGQRAALDRLVRDVGPRLLAYVRRAYRLADAEEIVAETFCRAAENMTTLQQSARQDHYLLAVARNLCRDGIRRRRPEPLPGEPVDAHPADDPLPEATIDRRERDRALLDAVANLPDAQREIVALRLSAGLKFQQIAALLGIPLGTALSRMRAATRRLQNELRCVYER